jgi:hypothetical protein
MQFQRVSTCTALVIVQTLTTLLVLECSALPDPQIRIVINDGVVPLTGIKGCPEQRDGLCPVERFVAAQKETIARTDWIHDCYGNWSVPEGSQWGTVTGDAPR